MMKKTITIIILLAVVLCSCSILTGCAGGTILRTIESTDEELKAVGTVGDHEIHYDELRFLVMNYRSENQENDIDHDRLSSLISKAIMTNVAALETAAEHGIYPDSKEVLEYVDEKLNELAAELEKDLILKSDNKSIKPSKNQINNAYAEYLKEHYLTDRYYRYLLSVDGCFEQLEKKLIADGKLPSDETEIRDYIESNFICTYHVYIPFEENNSYNNAELVSWIARTNFLDDENKILLRNKLGLTEYEISQNISYEAKLYNNIIAAPNSTAKMKKLIGSTYNKDMEISVNGYYFTHGEFSESYENAAFDLELYEISDPVEDLETNGYYVIQRYELDSQYLNRNLDVLREQYYRSYTNTTINQKLSSLNFVLNDFGSNIDFSSIS